MLHAALYHYLRRECDNVIAAYTTLQQVPGDADAVHVLRVGVKKLRAFFALAKQLPGYSFGAGKHLRAVRLIQAVGGAARDTHLQEKHLRSYELKVKWRFAFAHLLLRNKQTTANTLLQATVKHSSLKQLGTLPEKFKEAIADIDAVAATIALEKYLQQQHQRITPPASRAHHDVWHSVRKDTKSLYYQLTIMEQVLPSHQTEVLIPHTKKAGELLGQWHDTSELLLFTKATIAQLKKEKIVLPVNASQLVQLLQVDMKEQLALCSKQLKELLVISF
ncbi:MAG: CHAD domain-containing protein [Chitinophaga sp.]|uniref:CHAD domain-containing protein n=1 Tax=Chitinophaga sp. TaxID=1869181 RepID=UPI001B217D1D|nr:CHAD domain-containing protein [Chitinophaga sp.]MBO9733107.1 CHAD domain-containing protein [Chitinophaga sp.]